MEKCAGLYRVFLAIIFCLLYPACVFAADTFTATVPAGTEVTMQDPNAVIPLTIANNSATLRIRQFTVTGDTARYSLSATSASPQGWCVSAVSANSITYALAQSNGKCTSGTTGSEIMPGASLLFNIVILPVAAASDVAGDSFTGITVNSDNGLTLSGTLPTWTRRSLGVTFTALPASVGVGGNITLAMQVLNDSTATQTTVGTILSPPSFSSAIVTNTGGPYYGSTILSADLIDTASTVSVASTAEFPSTGTVRIEGEDICYTGTTATSFTGATRGCNGTTAANHTANAAVYNKVPFSLSSGQMRTITWIYRADSTGSGYFTAVATGSGGTAKSMSVNSNTVVIGAFTASIAISPAQVMSGQAAPVVMTVANNGSTALVNVTPSALSGCPGGATETLASGPAPASVTSLAPGGYAVFQWTYTITGSPGQAYCLTGSAAANGPVSTNTATSNTGNISNYTVVLTPTTVTSGATNVTLAWTLYNGGGNPVRGVNISTPAGGGNWTCGSVTAPALWSGSCGAAVAFASGGAPSDIAPGGSGVFSITFSTTQTVASDTAVTFPVTLTVRGGQSDSIGTLASSVTMTVYRVILANSPAGPINADGSAYYVMTATLANGGVAAAGKTISFTTTNGSLSSSTATTDINGNAVVNLVSPVSTANTSAAVTASYLGASGTDTVSFTGWNKANIQYWGGLAPASVNCGSSYSITMNVKNVSATSMNLGTGSYFAFNDSSSGGSTIYQAFLDSAVSVPAGSIRALTFSSPTSAGGGGGVAVSPNFLTGAFSPIVNSAPPPASGLFFTDGGTNDQYRSVTDAVTVGGACGTVNINIMDWQEMR